MGRRSLIITLLGEIRDALREQSQLLRELRGRLHGTAFFQGAAQGSAADYQRVVVFAQYPLFAREYDWLKARRYISETPDGLIWNKSKQSLAEYFSAQKTNGKNHHWRDIEALFNIRGLRSSKSNNGSTFKKHCSADFTVLHSQLIAAGLREDAI